MIFDSHCHLGTTDEDPAATLDRARRAGVTAVLTVGVDLASSQQAQALRQAHPAVRYAAGLHPNGADRLAAEWAGLAELCRRPDCCAVGETGLDYYWDKTTPAQQQVALAAHLQLAGELGKPVIIHCRDAFADIFDQLGGFPQTLGVMHCFSGGVSEARRTLELGYDISFSGSLTYPGAGALREAAAFAPGDRILVETDAPFLPPQGHRGQTNEPAWIVHTLATLAALRGVTFERVVELTAANARRRFGDD